MNGIRQVIRQIISEREKELVYLERMKDDPTFIIKVLTYFLRALLAIFYLKCARSILAYPLTKKTRILRKNGKNAKIVEKRRLGGEILHWGPFFANNVEVFTGPLVTL